MTEEDIEMEIDEIDLSDGNISMFNIGDEDDEEEYEHDIWT